MIPTGAARLTLPSVPSTPTVSLPYGFSTPKGSTALLQAGSSLLDAIFNLRASTVGGERRAVSSNIDLAHDVLSIAFAATPIGPFIPLHKELVGLASKSFEGFLARRKLHQLKRRMRKAYERGLAEGRGEYYATRLGAARVGLNPEEVAPLGPVYQPPAVTVPARTYVSTTRRGVTHTGVLPAYDIVPPPVYDPAAMQPYYDPETRATQTERGIAIKYGEGIAATQERERYYNELLAAITRAPAPGRGQVPLILSRFRRAA